MALISENVFYNVQFIYLFIFLCWSKIYLLAFINWHLKVNIYVMLIVSTVIIVALSVISIDGNNGIVLLSRPE